MSYLGSPDQLYNLQRLRKRRERRNAIQSIALVISLGVLGVFFFGGPIYLASRLVWAGIGYLERH